MVILVQFPKLISHVFIKGLCVRYYVVRHKYPTEKHGWKHDTMKMRRPQGFKKAPQWLRDGGEGERASKSSSYSLSMQWKPWIKN